ncbi:hypothetical protein BWZ20_03835 [Winogradskyella sp. J14-2]|uniref:DUF6095 family protein n=1 Tax=Winogradskyella sp. J14-2 TaxID=1936080 RepID=UPI000972D7CF|nr:DUF6095 family protein [Winogradskyella sp. J14-2]APY07483.1 hypothetical protein BWZ20_03835 [Winogradskyella sp. J14-2]
MEEENNKTDKELLRKGLKRLVICLFLMFLGPTLLHIAFSNNEKAFYYPILIVALLICITAIVMLYIGLNTIMNSIFNKEN